jgi:hypothetical protein
VRQSGDGVLFIGDSMNELFSRTLANAFMIKEGKCSQRLLGYLPCVDAGEKWEMKLDAARSDRLYLVDNAVEDEVNNFHDRPFKSFLHRDPPYSLIVMNRGAHFEPTEKVILDLNVTLNYIFSESKASVVWRSTVSGHDNTELNFFSFPETTHTPPSSPQARKFHWDQFEEQNIEVEAFLRLFFPQVIFLDVAPSTSLRRDSHMDALHYCVPGPIDNWLLLLFNVLLLIDMETVASFD